VTIMKVHAQMLKRLQVGPLWWKGACDAVLVQIPACTEGLRSITFLFQWDVDIANATATTR
jgi:hypothetical protein